MPVRICFVCLGNICRSPTAQGVMEKLVADAGLTPHIAIRSAGIGHWHVGEAPDHRSQAAARRRGYTLNSRARQFAAADLAEHDYILAMDSDNHRALLAMTRSDADAARIHLLRAFDPAAPPGAEVPDPYYGGPGGFDEVLDICEAACAGLLAHIRHSAGL
jgi:protein-tyrosine phosphatase